MRTRGVGLRALALAGGVVLAGCGGGTTAEGCPRSQEGDWTRVLASTRDFEISLCVPPGYHADGVLAWSQPSTGGVIRVENGLVHMGALAVLSPCAELNICSLDSAQSSVRGLRKDLRMRDQRATVVESGLLTDGATGVRGASAALLRVELGPDQFAVVRTMEREPDRLKQLRRVLDSVRFERVGGAGAP